MTQPQPFPNLPQPPPRPRMFADQRARIIWTLVPVVSASLLAFLPFVIARSKGVVTTGLAASYVAATAVAFGLATVLPQDDPPLAGLVLIVLMVTSAVHTWLLDTDAVKIGKTW